MTQRTVAITGASAGIGRAAARRGRCRPLDNTTAASAARRPRFTRLATPRQGPDRADDVCLAAVGVRARVRPRIVRITQGKGDVKRGAPPRRGLQRQGGMQDFAEPLDDRESDALP